MRNRPLLKVIALTLFAIMHMVGNLTFFSSNPNAYNEYAHMLLGLGRCRKSGTTTRIRPVSSIRPTRGSTPFSWSGPVSPEALRLPRLRSSRRRCFLDPGTSP